MNYQEILDLKMGPNDADAETIGQYLCNLLLQVWMEGESFSGKRPFGNSGWEHDLYETLARAGIVNSEVDEEGYVDNVDTGQAHQVISEVICASFSLELDQ